MNLKAKAYEEAHKLAMEQKLAARLAILNEKGIDDARVQRDPKIKNFKADIRKANRRLRAISAHEKLLAEKARAKSAKQAEKQAEKQPGKDKAKGDAGKKAAVKGSGSNKVKKEKKAKPAAK